jgi:hypothetical protein
MDGNANDGVAGENENIPSDVEVLRAVPMRTTSGTGAGNDTCSAPAVRTTSRAGVATTR